MPTLKLTKTIIDDLKPNESDQVYWDDALRGFGVKVTPAGRKVFIVMYRTTDSRRLLRKFTIGPYGVLTLHSARAAAQKILLARLDGKDPAGEKQANRRRHIGLAVQTILARYREEYLEHRAVGGETVRILERIVLAEWKGRQITADYRDQPVGRQGYCRRHYSPRGHCHGRQGLHGGSGAIQLVRWEGAARDHSMRRPYPTAGRPCPGSGAFGRGIGRGPPDRS